MTFSEWVRDYITRANHRVDYCPVGHSRFAHTTSMVKDKGSWRPVCRICENARKRKQRKARKDRV